MQSFISTQLIVTPSLGIIWLESIRATDVRSLITRFSVLSRFPERLDFTPSSPTPLTTDTLLSWIGRDFISSASIVQSWTRMRRRCGYDVIFYLPHAVVTIFSTVLQKSLPLFLFTHYSDADWDYRDEPRCQSPDYLTAFELILHHLRNIQVSGASCWLFHELEDMWKDDRRRGGCLLESRSVKVFNKLGYIFDQYGCSYDILQILNRFFARHEDEIVLQEHGIRVHEIYYSILKKIGYNMEHTSSLLKRAQLENGRELAPSDRQRICYRNGGRPCQLQDCLDEPLHRRGNGVVGGDWSHLALRRRIGHDGNNRIHRRGIINGEELDINELCRAWKRDPGSITVDEQRFLGPCEGCISNCEPEFGGFIRQKRPLPRRGLILAGDERRTPRLRRR